MLFRSFKSEVRPILITHEVNEVTEELIINEKIDYIISQNMSQLLIKTAEKLQNIKEGNDFAIHTFLPIEIITRFTLPTLV